MKISYQQYGSPRRQTHSARHDPEGTSSPPGRDKACAGQFWQNCPSRFGLKAVEPPSVCLRRSAKPYPLLFPIVNRQKGVPFFARGDGPIFAICGIPLSIRIPFVWVSRNLVQKLPEVWQSIGLTDLITILRLRRHLSRMAMPLAKSLKDAV